MTVTRERPELKPNQGFDQQARTIVNETRRGKLNNGGEVTLTANAASTTLSDPLITTNSRVALEMPMSANAAGALGTTYFDAPASGSVVIRHANNAQTDRTCRYGVYG